MTDDLSTLLQPVREAVARFSDMIADAAIVNPANEAGDKNALRAVSAELLRLYAENAQLRDVCADSELNREGIKHAHAELKALRERIEDAPAGKVWDESDWHGDWGIDMDTPSALIGKRVRLVVED
jgi:hypothetical protein